MELDDEALSCLQRSTVAQNCQNFCHEKICRFDLYRHHRPYGYRDLIGGQMKMEIFYLVGLGLLFGALIVYATMKLIGFYQGFEKRISETEEQIKELEAQIKGKQLPFYVRDGLEEIKALENKDTFDLARMRLYLEEAIKTVDQAADRQTKMGDVYDALRNHKKN